MFDFGLSDSHDVMIRFWAVMSLYTRIAGIYLLGIWVLLRVSNLKSTGVGVLVLVLVLEILANRGF